METVPEYFGCHVFNDATMRTRLPKDTYKKLKRTIEEGKHLDLSIANEVAHAMKEWAIENGATHFTHWFQPMTGITAEKHDSFITPGDDGTVIMTFSGRELIQGEPDASSFPSGGLRATFEARGYTAWDPSSYAFIKDGTLCIPTAFCSYGGEALDKKTPLLRSMEAINRQAKRILKLFGNEVKTVRTTVGPEQEYFLIDRGEYLKRKDLIFTGRTLFGAMPPKGQELEDHYYGMIKPRVAAYMADLDRELWKLGVLSKTKHNEAAPAQHEMAPIYTTTNIAVDHNQLTMETMKKVAERHGMVCLLHEKPFAGVNGSGKHNNWSLCTDAGTNLLEPGDTPFENAQFLLFLTAVIKAVHEHQDLLRISVASAGNDHRLGANEAPPAIVSMFLGDELTEIIESIVNDAGYDRKERVPMKIGVHILPRFPKDNTDRNRTSPFAFTGNKFEFRMLGSSASVATPNFILNTIVADALEQFADRLEAVPAQDFGAALHELIREELIAHKNIIFNGNGYDDEWTREATEKRGLLDLRATPDALPYFIREDNIALFERQRVLTRTEIVSRYDILLDNYCKVVKIEALTAIDMVKKDILPAVAAYQAELARGIAEKRAVLADLPCDYEEDALRALAALSSSIFEKLGALERELASVQARPERQTQAMQYKDRILPCMQSLRADVDRAETLTAKDFWPFPAYSDLLFGIL